MDDPALEPLDNIVWHALRGPHARVAEGSSRAARYPSTVSPFAGLPDHPTGDDWKALAELVGPGNIAVLFRGSVEIPAAWHQVDTLPTYQLVGPDVPGAAGVTARVLAAADVDQMLELVRRTEPGPFARRTIELGTYLGLFERGRLVAMAGERLRVDGFGEISAVCTDPQHRARGLAQDLVRQLVTLIRDRGDTPMLHVLQTNEPAHRLYLHLGFVLRREVVAPILQAPDG